MAAITEDYVSFETAKLLKEKGFDAECRAAYTNYGKLFTTQIQQYVTNVICSKGILWDCVAPTSQMAMKWLRVVHNIIEISVDAMLEDKGYQWALYNNDTKEIKPYSGWGDSYEEACEAALNYCLENLI